MKLNHYLLLPLILLFFTQHSVAQSCNGLNISGSINDYVNLGNVGGVGGDLYLVGASTLESWVRLENYPSFYGTIIRNGTGAADELFSLLIDDMGRVTTFWTNSSSTFMDERTVSTLNLNQWYHIAVVREDATTFRMYIDGVEQTLLGNMIDAPNGGGQVILGSGFPNGTFTLDGTIDELRVWSEARSTIEIVNNMNTEINPNQFSLQAYFRFNQGVAGGNNAGETILEDLSPNGNNGTLNNFSLSGAESNWVEGAPIAKYTPPIPTMGEWSLLIFGLSLFTISIVIVYNLNSRKQLTL